MLCLQCQHSTSRACCCSGAARRRSCLCHWTSGSQQQPSLAAACWSSLLYSQVSTSVAPVLPVFCPHSHLQESRVGPIASRLVCQPCCRAAAPHDYPAVLLMCTRMQMGSLSDSCSCAQDCHIGSGTGCTSWASQTWSAFLGAACPCRRLGNGVPWLPLWPACWAWRPLRRRPKSGCVALTCSRPVHC